MKQTSDILLPALIGGGQDEYMSGMVEMCGKSILRPLATHRVSPVLRGVDALSRLLRLIYSRSSGKSLKMRDRVKVISQNRKKEVPVMAARNGSTDSNCRAMYKNAVIKQR
jgi:hypothetical protein